MNKRNVLTLGFAVNSVAPMGIVALHEGLLTSIETVALTSPLFLTLFLMLRSEWPSQGLYSYVNRVSTKLGMVQLVSWLGSYFLYLSYTVDYIGYWLLGLRGVEFYLVTSTLGFSILVLILTNLEYYGLLIMAVSQVLLSLPIGWKLSPYLAFPPIDFLSPLTSALVVICVTLIPYSQPGRPRYVLYVFGLSSIMFVISSFFSVPSYFVKFSSISAAALVIAEFTAIKRLIWVGFRSRKLFLLLCVVFLITLMAGLPYPVSYYDLTVAPSVALLYFTLGLTFFAMPFYFRRPLHSLLSLLTAGLVTYGLYSVLVSSTPIQLSLEIGAMLGSVSLPFLVKVIEVLFKKGKSP
ncbi:hypothetical protein [Sulfodiicoccus acidiphilus]|uniref:hypothetical protein n=1 Tax=Sulfodiicoccus acidiphilus TaxID=1670455 RepID=UPI000F83DDE1|nr:hypothetical protein [Sulfodiicoccus acidiphilus]